MDDVRYEYDTSLVSDDLYLLNENQDMLFEADDSDLMCVDEDPNEIESSIASVSSVLPTGIGAVVRNGAGHIMK